MSDLTGLVDAAARWWPIALVIFVGAVWTGIEAPGKVWRGIKSLDGPKPRKLHYRNIVAQLRGPDHHSHMSVQANVQLYNPEDVDLKIEVESLRTSVRDRVTDSVPERSFVVPAQNDRVHVQSEPLIITLRKDQSRISCFVDWILRYGEASAGKLPFAFELRGNLECERFSGVWENRWTPMEGIQWPTAEIDAEITEDESGEHTRLKE